MTDALQDKVLEETQRTASSPWGPRSTAEGMKCTSRGRGFHWLTINGAEEKYGLDADGNGEGWVSTEKVFGPLIQSGP